MEREMQKTNVMRILDQKGIRYDVITYQCEDFISGVEVAKKTNVPTEKMFKTLVAQGKSERYHVFVVPVDKELDVKKAARSVDEKSVELIPVKDINKITGYVRGGCSPLGIKRRCSIVIHNSCNDLDSICVSAGILGCSIILKPSDLVSAAEAKVADLVLEGVTLE